MNTKRHWARKQWKRQTYFSQDLFFPEAIPESLSAPGVMWPVRGPVSEGVVWTRVKVRPRRFVSHSPKSPIHRRAERFISPYRTELRYLNLQMPPAIYDAGDALIRRAQILSGVSPVEQDKRYRDIFHDAEGRN